MSIYIQGTMLTFAATSPVGQVRYNFHLPHSNFHLPLKNCMLYNFSFGTKKSMVLACENIFSKASLDARPRNLHTFSKVNPKYIQRTCPVGQARYSFHLPYSYNLQILFARGNGASTNVEPCILFFFYHIGRMPPFREQIPDPRGGYRRGGNVRR